MSNDLIREAVTLAKGWSVDELGLVRAPFGSLQPVENMKQAYLDALAAQLIRQVDALSWLELVSGSGNVTIYENIGHGKQNLLQDAEGEGRTMSTIRAIIDSRCLDE